MSFSSFRNRVYMGKDKYGNCKTVLVLRKTPEYVYYKLDTGEEGRSKLYTDAYGECIKIRKFNDLYVSASNIYD